MPANPDAAAVLDALDEPAFLLDRGGVVRHANPAAAQFLRRPLATLNGQPLAALVASPADRLAPFLDLCARSSQSMVGGLVVTDQEGRSLSCPARGCRIALAGGAFTLLRLQVGEAKRFRALTDKTISLNAELTENKRIRRDLKLALEEKEVLLREVNHRVKNNLQMLQGVLSLTERATADERSREAVRSVRLRVEAMGLVQRLLYQKDDVSGIDGAAFIRLLVDNCVSAFGRSDIAVTTTCEPVEVRSDTAFLLGLAANELITNALKYAFTDRPAGALAVDLTPHGQRAGVIRLVVADDGVGMAADAPPGTGLALVRHLVRRPGGSFSVESSRGTRCIVEFPI
ncbi:histidine kinase dimerization/phosphoacceptor domain -containing protein [Caenispirillum bisanense]|uniref:histidine kinase dimerization/phosphoacceptor domain -containing protein n=1 Tax=Caenispirillum bisanense TaxID=414052 RepID=UPI0031D46636